MSNRSYCRFQNTASDLADCYHNLNEPLQSEEERSARTRLLALCVKIAAEAVPTSELPEEDDEELEWEAN